jgi:hypothetical protein
MAITLVGTRSGGSSNGNDVTITLPGGTAENDIVLVMGGNGASAGDAGVNTSGYSEIVDRINSTCALSVSWKRMSGSPDSSVSCKGSGNGNDATSYVVMVFRGVSTGVSAVDATDTEGSGDKPNSPPITVTTSSSAVVSCFIQAADEAALDPPSGYGDSIELNRTEANPVTVGAAWDTVSAGTENPAPWDSGTADRWVAASVVLVPAVVGTVEDAVFSATGTATLTMANGTLSVMRATGTGTATFRGRAIKPAVFAATGTITPSIVGTGASPNPAPFSMTGTGTASFVGALQGAGGLSATGTANVNFVGDYPVDSTFSAAMSHSVSFIGAVDKLRHVREVIESRGTATVTMRV